MHICSKALAAGEGGQNPSAPFSGEDRESVVNVSSSPEGEDGRSRSRPAVTFEFGSLGEATGFADLLISCQGCESQAAMPMSCRIASTSLSCTWPFGAVFRLAALGLRLGEWRHMCEATLSLFFDMHSFYALVPSALYRCIAAQQSRISNVSSAAACLHSVVLAFLFGRSSDSSSEATERARCWETPCCGNGRGRSPQKNFHSRAGGQRCGE